jgi:Secretion system C-terminal sorting domain
MNKSFLQIIIFSFITSFSSLFGQCNSVSGLVFHSITYNGTNGITCNYTATISLVVSSAGNASACLKYTGGQLQICYNGPSTLVNQQVSFDATCGTSITLSGYNSPNGGGSQCSVPTPITINAPLPVEMIDFDATDQNNKSILKWTTASETNNDFFTIERSADGRNFENIGETKGAGNSSHEITYTFTDAHPVPGINYYRIKQTDYDGQFSYSEIRSVRHTGLSNVSVTPRTTEDRLYITTELDDYSITIYNASGQQVKRMVDMSLDQNISIETLNAGVYFIQINSRTESETVKIVKIW